MLGGDVTGGTASEFGIVDRLVCELGLPNAVGRDLGRAGVFSLGQGLATASSRSDEGFIDARRRKRFRGLERSRNNSIRVGC